MHVSLKITQIKKNTFPSKLLLTEKSAKLVAGLFPGYLEYLRGGAAC